MTCSSIRQMRMQRPLGSIFQKLVEEGGKGVGGGVCCADERFVGRLLPPCLATSNRSAATGSILRNFMGWPPSQGFESAHVRTKKVLRFVYTRLIWTYLFARVFVCICLNIFVCSRFCLHMFEHICLLMICCICLWTYLFAHVFVCICLNIFVCSWFVFAHQQQRVDQQKDISTAGVVPVFHFRSQGLRRFSFHLMKMRIIM